VTACYKDRVTRKNVGERHTISRKLVKWVGRCNIDTYLRISERTISKATEWRSHQSEREKSSRSGTLRKRKQEGNVRRICRASILIVCLFAITGWSQVQNRSVDLGRESLTAELKGFEETPAVSTSGSGDFRAVVNSDGTITYRLRYAIEPIEGVKVTVAHIHIGQHGVAGGIVVFFCGGGGKPACASPSGVIEDTITAADVLALAGQGIEAGNLAEVLHAIRAGAAYVNVHSSRFPAGEIRGQIRHADSIDR
jgi:hypothetical protein